MGPPPGPGPRLLLGLLCLLADLAPRRADNIISLETVQSWSQKLGMELFALGNHVTNYETVRSKYKKDVDVKAIDGAHLADEIARRIQNMISSKVDAVKRIMDVAESSALSEYETNYEFDAEAYNFTDAKNNTLPKVYSEHFGGEVNLNTSAVHVPTTVYGHAYGVVRAIKWSKELDETFKNNYKNDPSLSWQYFGSSTGFLRQYPALDWKPDGTDPHNPDLYDCRSRSWYIEAATSPKDIIILVDISGSMTGMRKEIARHVINNILNTLGNNDYVNVIKFSNITEQAVPCFGDGLVQANLANVRQLKNGIAEMNTERIANFSMILTHAFELLERMRYERTGACCNQAIMLITDGVPEDYREIFRKYNWADDPDEPDNVDMPVRLFTYVIGRDVADIKDVRWMACANRGFFVQLSTLAEVREQVLHYVAVMARPLVLNLTTHPTVWTPVYADIADPKITDWLWDKKERGEQRDRYWIYRNNKRVIQLKSEIEQYVKRVRKHPQPVGEMYKYRLMTSVSMPVFDRRENANITEYVLVKNAYWVKETKEKRIAELLGVAGTDVPIDEIKQLMMPDLLGVHGYAFIVTNNGYILTHPDLRPVFQGILKPAYNSVDMTEVELIDSDVEPREFDSNMLKFRENVVYQIKSELTATTKYHYDNMQRAGKMKRKYFAVPIENTTFTLIVSLPLMNGGSEGPFHVQAQLDIRREELEGRTKGEAFFKDKNWRVHPEWLYCKYHFDATYNFSSPEEQLMHFVPKISQPNWKWGSEPVERIAQSKASSIGGKKPDDSNDPHYCNRELVLSLMFDAKATMWSAASHGTNSDTGKEKQQRFGLTLAFVATRSGLTRWQDAANDEPEAELPPDHFSKLYPRAIEETWYKRAVDHYYKDPNSFVFSLPIDEDGAVNTTLLTATRAIFVDKKDRKGKAPAAVMGFQMLHTGLQSLFQNITYTCNDSSKCDNHCGNPNIDCYLLDNHGYVMAAKEPTKAGRFFGDVHGAIMRDLIQQEVYEKISIFDYQAVCFINIKDVNNANILLTPFKSLMVLVSWLYAQTAFYLAQFGVWELGGVGGTSFTSDVDNTLEDIIGANEDLPISVINQNDNKPAANQKDDYFFDHLVRIKRTRPEACDKQVDLYLFKGITRETAVHSTGEERSSDESSEDCTNVKYVMQPVDHTNMILIAIDTKGCTIENTERLSIESEEIFYSVNDTLACRKSRTNLPRKRPESCIRSHPKESEIRDLCGAAANARLDLRILLVPVIWTCYFLARRVVAS